MRFVALTPVAAAALVLVASGCGGDSSQSAAAEEWADGVCAAITTWKTDVAAISTEAAEAITEPGATRDDVTTAVDDGLQATESLVDELKALGPPDTPEGGDAKKEIDAFLEDAEGSADEVRTTLAGLPETGSVTALVTELSGLATNLASTIESGRALVATLEDLGGDLRDGFENAESCQELRGEA